MAMYKKATFSHKCKVTALNNPQGEGWDIYNLPNQIKTASINIKDEDLDGFDLKQATTEHPDHLYIKIFAIKKDEPNDNGDAFSAKELKTAADSFVGVPLFTNHQNDDVEKARGECVHSWYDTDEGGIFIIGRVDKLAYPRLARGIEEGYITGTSMGCSVENSLCSVCHNKAHTAEDYCSHVANRKNRKYNGDMKCAYHNSPVDKDDKCPLCGSTKDDGKTLKHADQQIYEHNYGLKFIENSFVVNPACDNCGVTCVLNAPVVEAKVASLARNMDHLMKQSYLDEKLTKVAGVQELDSLKNSMTEMEAVVKSMLKQKENISMEYVSDLVTAMSDVQKIFDELVEMGYGGLPSPPPTAGEEAPVVAGQFPEPVPPQQMPPQPVSNEGGASETSDMGGLGNLTMPKNSSKNKEDFASINKNIINKIGSLTESLSELNKNINSQREIGAKMATDKKTTKTAAGTDNLEVITEKQLMKEEENLHPRTGEVYEGITESKEQIAGSERSNDTTSDSPQVRLGTYETITEDQLKTQSALGDAVIHFREYPDVITEKQWDDFSRDVAGDLPSDYTEQITQAQIRELLSKHKYIGNVETITEDQLRGIDMTDGLKRWANKDYSISLVKTATGVIADMISLYGKAPAEIRKIASVISDDIEIKSKVAFLSVANSLPRKKDSREAIASRAKYFSKTASKDIVSTMDALILSAAKHGQFGMKAEDVLDFVGQVVNSKTAMTRVNTMLKAETIPEKVTTKVSAFGSAMKELDKPADGLYRIKATMEDIGVPITDKVAFLAGVKKFANEMIDDDSVASAVIKIEAPEGGGLVIDIQDGAEEEITVDDIGDAIEGPIEGIDADINGEGPECPFDDNETPELEEGKPAIDPMGGGQPSLAQPNPALASAKKEIKTAQMMGGEMGGMGGASQAPGAGATMPQAPEMGQPPMESLTEDPMADEEGGLEDNLEPLPPGSICPACGSDDVDIIGGKGKCNNCSSEMTYKVEVNVTKWQGTTPDEEDDMGAGEEGFEGEGFEMPEEPGMGDELGGAEMGGMGGEEMGGGMGGMASTKNWRVNKFAATMKMTPKVVKKASENNIKIGSVSPATGSTNTVKLEDGSYICMDTGTKYKVAYMVSRDGKQVYGQWEWEPKVANAVCPSCSRAKQKFVKALASVNMKEAEFSAMGIQDQANTIIKLKQAGSLGRTIKTASKEGSVIGDYKLAYGGYGKSFPIESCIEKLARRFGNDALCLSGPDEGKPLATSICNRLKSADVYTDKIAIKLADNWQDCDGDEECITHQVRSGHNLRQAAEICTVLKVAVADGEEFLADDLAGDDSFDDTPMEDDGMGIEDEVEVDPFEDEMGGGIGDELGDEMGEEHGGTVTLELPIEIVEQIEQAIEVAEGEGAEGIEEEMAEGEDIGGLPGEDIGGLPGEDIGGLPGEELAGDLEEGGIPTEESIAPEELNPALKPAMDPTGMDPTGMDVGGPGPMKAALEPDMGQGGIGMAAPAQNLQDQPMGGDPMKPAIDPMGGEMSQATDVGGISPFDQDLQNIQNKGGVPGGGVEIRHNGVATANTMDTSIGKTGKNRMDLSGIIDVLNKSASEKEISQEKAQDSKDIGQYTAGEGGSEMGHESETIRTPQKPSVPRDSALMGQEDSDLNPQDKPLPVIPSGDATMGHEKEVGLGDIVPDNRFTGGTDGQGKTELASVDEDYEMMKHMRGFGTSKQGISSLADRIAKKLAPKEPVAKDPDIQPIDAGDGSTIGKEEKFTAEEPTNVEGSATESLMGHEGETLKAAPKEPADQPDIFTGNAQQGQEELDSEKTNKDKGTVIASGDSESEAIRVAGRMLQASHIAVADLPTKINELKAYKPSQIRDIEKSIFAQKGLNTVDDGKLSQSVQINETSSVRNAKDELSTKISTLFSLDRQNKEADDSELAQLRKTYGK
jgi:hypothetical protein